MVKKEEFTYDSRDGVTKIHAVRYVPEGKISCILQLVHGMAEYIERYEKMAYFFAEKGILVVGNDHLGHGKSLRRQGEYGYFCEQDPATVVVRDVHRLKKMTQEDYPGLPYIILGHSMGSLILENYLFRYGTGIQGAILCGVSYEPYLKLKAGKMTTWFTTLLKGDKAPAVMVSRLSFGKHNSHIQDAKTEYDWLCTDPKVIEAYIKDPLCGFTFTANGFKTLLELSERTHQKENLLSLPKETPVYFIAGEEDPVGGYGEGVRKVYQNFKEAGVVSLEMKLYPGDRHEILNEHDKEQVYQDVYSWLLKRIEEYQL